MVDAPNANANLPAVTSQTGSDKGYQNFGPIPQLTHGMTFHELGSYGLRAFGGFVREEFLPQLQGRQGATVYREMSDNSAIIGGMIFAIQSTMRKVQWRVTAASDTPEDQEAADFAESLMDDMAVTWEDVIADGLSMVTYGYAPMELCYKRRLGHDPGPMELRPGKMKPRSKFDDGKVGWDKIAIRGQDTVLKWFFDQDGDWLGLTQQPYIGPMLDVPREKLLLFRPSQHKNNPEGRALDPETMIPTPDGWRRMDDLQVGDKVFDETGAIRYITARADWDDRPVHRLTFSDGFSIIADDNHEWLTQNYTERHKHRPGELRTTAEVAASIKAPGGTSSHSIAWAGALDYPEQVLPFDPYLLGMWLGDGNSRNASIACHADDLEETLALVQGAGYVTTVRPNGAEGGNGRQITFSGDKKWASDGPVQTLRIMGVLNNKHIPAAYLRGSRAQRMALLSGLMDSDGHVDNSGRCEFSNTNAGLAYGVAELVRSLGIGAALSEKRNSHGSPAWLVKFTPTWVPFRLNRKAARCRTERQRMNHYIVSAEPLTRRRTVCIEVDSPSHLFLAGEGMVPTHNSVLRNAYRSYYMVKRLEEQEAILFERLGGIPVIKVPGNVLAAAQAGDAEMIATVEGFKRIAMNLRVDEQMGVVLPSDVFENQNGAGSIPMYSLELVAPGGGKGGGSSADSNAIITRHNNSMMMSTLADFLLLGHGPNGTESLSDSKKGMFFQGVEGYLNSMASVINKDGLERIWDLNAMDPDTMPVVEPDLAQELDLDILGTFIEKLANSGMAVFPNVALESALMDAAGLPDINDPSAMDLLDEATDEPAAIVGPHADALSAELAPPPAPVIAPPGAKPGAFGDKPPAPGSPTEKLMKMMQASISRRVLKRQGNRQNIDTRRAPARRAPVA